MPANNNDHHDRSENPEQPEPPKLVEVEIAGHQCQRQRQYLENTPANPCHDHLRPDQDLSVRGCQMVHLFRATPLRARSAEPRDPCQQYAALTVPMRFTLQR